MLFILTILFLIYVASAQEQCVAKPGGDPKEHCTYQVTGVNRCHGWGDPHFTTFNGRKHDFQGINLGSYYYVTLCDGYTVEDMPVQILGKHFIWSGAYNGLDYFIFQLYESPTVSYRLFFATGILGWAVDSDQITEDWFAMQNDRTVAAQFTTYNPKVINNFKIGDRFQVSTSIPGANQHTLVLTVDGDVRQRMTVHMVGTHNFRDGHWRLHAFNIYQAEQYKCASCGICGDFHYYGTTQDCLGNVIPIDNTRMFDENGWTYEIEHHDGVCTEDDYPPEEPPPAGEQCPDVSSTNTVTAACMRAVSNPEIQACCQPEDSCFETQESCIFDLCVDFDEINNDEGQTFYRTAREFVRAEALTDCDDVEYTADAAAHEVPVIYFKDPNEDNKVPNDDNNNSPDDFSVPNDLIKPAPQPQPIPTNGFTFTITRYALFMTALTVVNIVAVVLSCYLCLKKNKRVVYQKVSMASTTDEDDSTEV